jgi:pimeloyl-ACP methyl ester carboxylesterase
LPQITLQDGRRLHFREFGPADGYPIFHFHGIAGSGLDAALYGEAPNIARVRLISPDRPGLGESDFQTARQILDWPGDITELADHLALDSFSVVAVSGGAPYALACAQRLSQRLNTCGIVSGAGPASLIPTRERRFRATYFGIRRLPLLYKVFARSLTVWRRSHPNQRFSVPSALLAQADAEVLRNPDMLSILTRVAWEGARPGAAGSIIEGALLAGDWGFRPQEIELKRCFLWHGEGDRIVPVAIGRSLAASVPGARAKFYPGEGHYSVMVNHGVEILSALATSD